MLFGQLPHQERHAAHGPMRNRKYEQALHSALARYINAIQILILLYFIFKYTGSIMVKLR